MIDFSKHSVRTHWLAKTITTMVDQLYTSGIPNDPSDVRTLQETAPLAAELSGLILKCWNQKSNTEG